MLYVGYGDTGISPNNGNRKTKQYARASRSVRAVGGFVMTGTGPGGVAPGIFTIVYLRLFFVSRHQ